VKFGPYADKTPLAWMIGRLRQRVNSRRAGSEKLGYMRGSLQVLLAALLRAFDQSGVRVQTGVSVRGVVRQDGRAQALQTSAGPIPADAYLFTIPTPVTAEVLQSACPEYATQLRQIEYFGAVCTILELRRSLIPVYWLNIADPGLPFGGIIEHTNLVPPSAYDGRHVVYLSRYFAATDDLARQTPERIEQIMRAGLKKVCPALSDADVLKVHVFSSRTAAVVCDLNFSRKVPTCRTPLSNLYVAAMPHVYPDERSCNNSVRVAAEACRVMGLDTSAVPRRASLAGRIGMR
jgi:protoporphyrinogen oxidase